MGKSEQNDEGLEPDSGPVGEHEVGDPTETKAEEQSETDLTGEEDPIAKLERDRDEYLDLARRTQAEFENYRRRMSAEVQAAEARGKAGLAEGLLGVLDNLERALEAIEVDPAAAADGDASVDGPLEQGVILTYRELCGVADRAGLEGYDPSGERFDPNWHEALQTRPDDDVESGVVVEVVQKGYRLGDRVLRPARVIVSA